MTDVDIWDVATWDTETIGGLGGVFKCGVCYVPPEGKCYRFLNRTEQIEFMMSRPEFVWYAHNMHFDIGKLWPTNTIIRHEKIVVHGKIIQMKVMGKNGLVIFRDSSSLLPTKLEKLGSKGTTPLNILNKPVNTQEEWDKIWTYCEDDCKVLHGAMVAFQKTFSDIHNKVRHGKRNRDKALKLTVSSQMLSLFKTKVDLAYWESGNGLVLKDNIRRHNEFAQDAYYGGRTENTIIGVVHDTMTYWDINSMYPHAGCWPIPDPGEMKETKLLDWKPFLSNTFSQEEGIVYITCAEQHPFPVLPTRENGRVIFRNGAKEGWYTLRDVRYGMAVGSLSNVQYNKAWTTPYLVYFREIFELLYSERKATAIEGVAEIVKIMMNGGYGKFGETVPVEDTYKNYDTWSEWNDAMTEYGDRVVWHDDERYMLQIKAEEEVATDHTAFVIAAYITSQARIVLHEYISQILKAGYKVYYMDTDSLVTNAPKTFFRNTKELGDMKLEGVISGLWTMAPKCYMMRYTEKLDKKTGLLVPVAYDDFKHKGVKLKDGVEKRIRDVVTGEMQLGLYKYLSAMRYGKQMFDEKVMADRHHSFDHQKRYYDGIIKPADELYKIFKTDGEDYISTRPYNTMQEHEANIKHLTDEDKLVMRDIAERRAAKVKRTRVDKYMPKLTTIDDDPDLVDDTLTPSERNKKTEIDDIVHGYN